MYLLTLTISNSSKSKCDISNKQESITAYTAFICFAISLKTISLALWLNIKLTFECLFLIPSTITFSILSGKYTSWGLFTSDNIITAVLISSDIAHTLSTIFTATIPISLMLYNPSSVTFPLSLIKMSNKPLALCLSSKILSDKPFISSNTCLSQFT